MCLLTLRIITQCTNSFFFCKRDKNLDRTFNFICLVLFIPTKPFSLSLCIYRYTVENSIHNLFPHVLYQINQVQEESWIYVPIVPTSRRPVLLPITLAHLSKRNVRFVTNVLLPETRQPLLGPFCSTFIFRPVLSENLLFIVTPNTISRKQTYSK